MIGPTSLDSASGDGSVTIATRNKRIPPRTRKPARARIHQLGRLSAGRSAASVAPRVVTLRSGGAVGHGAALGAVDGPAGSDGAGEAPPVRISSWARACFTSSISEP